jgi:hypothetical protein
MSKMKASVFEEAGLNGRYVIYRTGYPQQNPPLEYLEETEWDRYVVHYPKHKCEELSRGHTIVEAINLTMLANEEG